MKRYIIWTLTCVLLLASCKEEKKVTTFQDLYKEQPFAIITAPVQDLAPRIIVKNTQDKVLNDELDECAHFLRQSLTQPLVAMGYYALPPLSSDIILNKVDKNYQQLMQENVGEFSTNYGIDAILLVTLYKWKEPEINEIVVFAEYTLRSTKTGLELMHTCVRGRKIQPIDAKCEPVELDSDLRFIENSGLDKRLAHRCILLQEMSDFVLRSIPTSAGRWYFQHDQYISANPTYYSFVMLPDGSIERTEYDDLAFNNECLKN